MSLLESFAIVGSSIQDCSASEPEPGSMDKAHSWFGKVVAHKLVSISMHFALVVLHGVILQI
jgi:hypothetical protein